MKYFLLSLLLLPFISRAQDCPLKKTVDPYTKETRLSTGFISLQNASVSLDADNKELDLFFSLTGDKCFTDAATAVVIFEGSKLKTTLRNSGTMNCEGNFHVIFKNSQSVPSILQKMAVTGVQKIIFTGNDKTETTIMLTPEQQAAVIKLIGCMDTQAKTLLPPQ